MSQDDDVILFFILLAGGNEACAVSFFGYCVFRVGTDGIKVPRHSRAGVDSHHAGTQQRQQHSVQLAAK